MPEVVNEATARALCTRALRHVSAESAFVTLVSHSRGNTRAAANHISSSGEVRDIQLQLSAQEGNRRASVALNQADDRALTQAGRRLDALLRAAPEDSELPPPLEQPVYEAVAASFESTEALDADARAEVMAELVRSAEAIGSTGSGFLDRDVVARAVASSTGLFAFHRSTLASFTATVRTADGGGAGWAGTAHNDWARTSPPSATIQRAVDKALRSRQPDALDPGAYTVVLEPTAVGNLLALLPPALDARDAEEGRSRFSRPGGGTLVGEQVVDGRITLLSDPADPDLLEPPFTDEGVPVSRTVWIEEGVLRNLGHSRYWATHKGVPPVPIAGGFKLLGTDRDMTSVVGAVERGVLVSRLWDLRPVDPRRLQFTGLTRDGTFLIENGQVTQALRNMRFNESLLGVLNRVDAIGRVERIVASEGDTPGPALAVPALVVRDFRFTAVSDAL